MAKVTAFQISGLQLSFYSNDHDPPHFHAKRNGEWEARVFFMERPEKMIEVMWEDKQLSAKARAALCKKAEKRRAQLLKQWESIRGEQG